MFSQQKSKQIFICFIGIDGSGKTTLATNLMALLRNEKVQTKYVWGAHNYVLLRPLTLLLKKHSRKSETTTPRNVNQTQRYGIARRIIKNPFMAKLYKVSVLSEYLLQILVKVRLPLIFGKNLICDRYVYDTAINLSVHLQYSQENFKILLNRLLGPCPKPSVLFFVDLPEEIAFKRKNDIPSTDYLIQRRKLYRLLAKEYAVTRLDGSESLSKLKLLMLNTVFKTYECDPDTYSISNKRIPM